MGLIPKVFHPFKRENNMYPTSLQIINPHTVLVALLGLCKAPSTRAIFMWQLYVAIFIFPCRWLDKYLLLTCVSNNFAQRRCPWKGKKQDGAMLDAQMLGTVGTGFYR